MVLGRSIILSTAAASSDQDLASAAYSAAFRLRSRRTRRIFSAISSIAAIATAIIIRRTVNRTRDSRIIEARAGRARQGARDDGRRIRIFP
jgi:hypothetical protein